MTEILFADDDEALRRMLGEYLRHAGYRVRLCESGTQALDEVRRSPPDLVILDYRMGVPDGFTVCRTLKADPRVSHVPVLILTGQSGIEDRLGGFEAGADDYLAKPFDPRELSARVSALLRQARRGLDRNPTTGIPGGEAIQREIDRRLADGAPFTLVYFDLDDFKPFADRFGFAVADEAIRDAGRALESATEGRDAFVGHVGGDDFVVVTATADGATVARAARGRFSELIQRRLPPETARTGTYRGMDRAGVEREFAVTRLSAAVVRVDPARWSTLERLGEVVAEAKRRAKLPGSSGIADTTL